MFRCQKELGLKAMSTKMVKIRSLLGLASKCKNKELAQRQVAVGALSQSLPLSGILQPGVEADRRPREKPASSVDSSIAAWRDAGRSGVRTRVMVSHKCVFTQTTISRLPFRNIAVRGLAQSHLLDFTTPSDRALTAILTYGLMVAHLTAVLSGPCGSGWWCSIGMQWCSI